MSNGKNPYLRYRIINACLTSKHKTYLTIAEIMDKLAEQDLLVEKRTIELDFETMRHDERLGYHAPIAYCRKNKGFYYTDNTYSTEAIPFSEEDLLALRFALGVLQYYKGTALVERFEGLIDRVVKLVNPFTISDQAEPSDPMVIFEDSSTGRGMEHFDTLLQAISNKEAVAIEYDRPRKKTSGYDLMLPYSLKERGGRWYLLCFSATKQDVVTLMLDRIWHIEGFD